MRCPLFNESSVGVKVMVWFGVGEGWEYVPLWVWVGVSAALWEYAQEDRRDWCVASCLTSRVGVEVWFGEREWV